MVDAVIERFTEKPEGADKTSLTPEGIIAYVETYAEATTGADVSGLTPENVTAMVSAYKEMAEGADMSTLKPDEIVAYCTALISAQGGGLVSLFTQLLDSRNGIHYEAENLCSYDGGIGGEVNGEPVLVGSLTFLANMGVEVPEGIRVGQAVCIAIDGELCGLFAVTYDKTRGASAGITTLCAYRGLRPIFAQSDFVLTRSFIKGKFGVEPKKLELPEEEVRVQLRQRERSGEAVVLTTAEGLAPFAYGVTGARSLHTAGMLGTIVHILGGSVGIAMMLVLAILGAGQLLTPGNMFLYQLIWMIPGLIISEWTRVI
jgi:hypothetical protein